MAPTRDEHEREIATAEAAAIGYSKRFRFRSVKVRGASGRANPGSKLSLRGLKPVPCHVKPSIGNVFSGFGDVVWLPIQVREKAFFAGPYWGEIGCIAKLVSRNDV
ncbi:hypothetical protein TrVFT333_003617 [Trichoderma virens FT-333]|nr:hypothetical protein TrVFT333_003617 [Trichoderma virens FT-333]